MKPVFDLTEARNRTIGVWVVILNYNRTLDTIGCLKALNMDGDFQVMVVDNGSPTNTLIPILTRFPGVRIIRNEKNRGYSGGMNAGLRTVTALNARYICVLNNDARFSADSLKLLTEAMDRDPHLAALSPAIYRLDAPTQPWFLGGILDERSGMAEHHNLMPNAALSNQPWLSGCALVLREQAIRTVGDFDERYYAYWEDVDWSVRARAAGWRLALHREAIAYHRVGSTLPPTSGDAIYYYTRNHLLFVHLNYHASVKLLSKIAALHLREALRELRADPQHRVHRLIHTAAGIYDFYRRRFGARPKPGRNGYKQNV